MVHSPLVDALLCGSAYPDRPEAVELVQTHISYVFLLSGADHSPSETGRGPSEFVYKIKKPVDFGFLDFSTLERRRFFCLEEVRLNSRLAPDIYLGVVPVFKEEKERGAVFRVGEVFIREGDAECASAVAAEAAGSVVVEYAVKMRRIASDTILDEMLRQERATAETLQRVARSIAAFHQKAEPLCRAEQVDTIAYNIMDNFSRIESFAGDEPGATIIRRRLEGLREFSAKFLAENRALLEERVRGGFIRDCHGDMHVDHVVVTENIAIFDCIEFSERLRLCDTVADAGFLSMDLEYLGRGDLAKVFEAEYKKVSGDAAPDALWNFYKCYRAVVRGKVASLKSIGSDIDETERSDAIRDAIKHFHLADLYAKGGAKPVLVVVSGLTATGKSTLVRALKGTSSMKVISTDATRRDIFNIPIGEDRRAQFGKDLYTEESVSRVYEAVFKEGERWLGLGRSVILDATFSKKRYIDSARDIAERCDALCFVVECVAGEASVKARMEKRSKEKDSLSDATYETYKKMKESFEPIEGDCLRINTDGDPVGIAGLLIKKVFGVMQ
ncbi:hypothetical protein MNBD_DELTA01-935 [hydrothermal vent metagenome]|uniref:Aminoglycoside phosphotransferase domain-containing protein n=1 Tax=hydrothermal vent metagenome TaxID=652676 RepID=A0A3B0QTU1_9ZZZZ